METLHWESQKFCLEQEYRDRFIRQFIILIHPLIFVQKSMIMTSHTLFPVSISQSFYLINSFRKFSRRKYLLILLCSSSSKSVRIWLLLLSDGQVVQWPLCNFSSIFFSGKYTNRIYQQVLKSQWPIRVYRVYHLSSRISATSYIPVSSRVSTDIG